MKTIKISDIIIKDRQRQVVSPEHITELQTSISSKCLLHPIVLENDERTLVSGECRIKAFMLHYDLDLGGNLVFDGKEIPRLEIPYVKLGDMSKDAIFELELEENTKRENLTVQQEAKAVGQLYELRKKNNEKYSMQALKQDIKELNLPIATRNVANLHIIAQHLDDEKVQKSKTQQEALRVIEKKEQEIQNKKLVEKFGKKPVDNNFMLRNEDCLEVMRRMPSGCVDAVCTDPPYGIGADSFGDMTSAGHEYEDSEFNWERLMYNFVTQLLRVMKNQSHAYIFCDVRRFLELKVIVEKVAQKIVFCGDVKVWSKPLIWYKKNGMLSYPDYGPRYTYDAILFINKGNKKVTVNAHDVITISNVANPVHGAQKPIELYKELLSRSIRPGDHVADFFAGTGPIVPAGNELSCKVTAVEKSNKFFGHIIATYEGILKNGQ